MEVVSMDRFLLRSPLLAGLLTVWLLVVIGALITAFILNYTDVQEQHFNYFSYTINSLALLVGGWIAGRKSGRKGWYFGAVTGGLYAVIVFLIGILAFDTSFDWFNLLHFAGAIAIAALGGMLGVSMRTSA
jgi:putative membrane protein (TIGR04086 family)